MTQPTKSERFYPNFSIEYPRPLRSDETYIKNMKDYVKAYLVQNNRNYAKNRSDTTVDHYIILISSSAKEGVDNIHFFIRKSWEEARKFKGDRHNIYLYD